MSLSEDLARLARGGCYPAISRRGEFVWRAHVNAAGNFWAEANTPYKALAKAVQLWRKAGKPMDGMAVEAHSAEDELRAQQASVNRCGDVSGRSGPVDL